jgi:serpin B
MDDLRLFPTCLALGALLLAGACTDDGSSDDGDNSPEFAEAHSDAKHDEAPSIDANEAETLAADDHALTLDLYHELRAGQAADEGFSISAYSIHSAFGMLYAGAVEPARSEMATTLHFSLAGERQYVAHNWLDAQLDERNLPAVTGDEGEQAAVELHSANGVWVLDQLADRISPDYLDLLAIHYDAGVYLAQFDTQPEVERAAINAWVSARTADLIPELFPAGTIEPLTRLVLVNAVYLKAPWADPFVEELTAPAPFYGLDGTESTVDMMHAGDLSADYGEGPGYQAVALPMRGDALELLVILPDDFGAFEADLDAAMLTNLRDEMSPTIVDLHLPKFELEAQFELTGELQELGMVAPFFDSHSFDAILPELGVITAVVHQTVIKVDEKGTEAAAATGIVVGETGIPEPGAEMIVDRPFLLAIRDAPTDTLLFFGRVLAP